MGGNKALCRLIVWLPRHNCGPSLKKKPKLFLVFLPSVHDHIILLICLIHLIPDRAPYVEYSARYSDFNF
jgi:hypothetical protein